METYSCKVNILVTQPVFAVFGQTGAHIDPLDDPYSQGPLLASAKSHVSTWGTFLKTGQLLKIGHFFQKMGQILKIVQKLNI